eukprot:7234431-Lingulodinium_polyedra.AAC.1
MPSNATPPAAMQDHATTCHPTPRRAIQFHTINCNLSGAQCKHKFKSDRNLMVAVSTPHI